MIVGPLDAAESVVAPWIGSVEAHGHAGKAGSPELLQAPPCRHGRATGRECRRQTDAARMTDELGQVPAPHRVAACQHEQGWGCPERADLVDETKSLVGGELAGVAPCDRVGAAVNAREGTGARDLPDHQEGSAFKIRGHGPSWSEGLGGQRMTAIICRANTPTAIVDLPLALEPSEGEGVAEGDDQDEGKAVSHLLNPHRLGTYPPVEAGQSEGCPREQESRGRNHHPGYVTCSGQR